MNKLKELVKFKFLYNDIDDLDRVKTSYFMELLFG